MKFKLISGHCKRKLSKKFTDNNPSIKCMCGCGNFIKKYDKRGTERSYFFGHGKKGKSKYNLSEMRKCACGCGGEFLKYDHKRREKKYVHGHYWRNKSFTKKARKNLSLARTGKHYPNLSLAKKGKPNLKNKEIRKRLYEEGKLPSFIGGRGKDNLMYGKRGPLAHTWLGGKSFEPYTFDFNKRFKEAIRERDNHCCLVCNKSEDELGYKLSVHHVDYNKKNSFQQNCGSVCKPHHADTNINRNAWKLYFHDLLAERYSYKYTEDQKIILDFNEV